MWHSRPRLCRPVRTAEGGCATRQNTTDRTLATERRWIAATGLNPQSGGCPAGVPCRICLQTSHSWASSISATRWSVGKGGDAALFRRALALVVYTQVVVGGPGGAIDSSPAIHRWVRRLKKPGSSRQGRLKVCLEIVVSIVPTGLPTGIVRPFFPAMKLLG